MIPLRTKERLEAAFPDTAFSYGTRDHIMWTGEPQESAVRAAIGDGKLALCRTWTTEEFAAWDAGTAAREAAAAATKRAANALKARLSALLPPGWHYDPWGTLTWEDGPPEALVRATIALPDGLQLMRAESTECLRQRLASERPARKERERAARLVAIAKGAHRRLLAYADANCRHPSAQLPLPISLPRSARP